MQPIKKAYGGVVISPSGEILLREPRGHYKGDIWTFAKGKPEGVETPEQTAVREVFEETGCRAEVVAKIPGAFETSRTVAEYFLMAPIEDTGHFDGETQAIRWAAAEEARRLILLNERPKRRRRDLRVLKLALSLFRSLGDSLHPVAL